MSQFAFSLVSPERELFSGDVDAVLVPGSEGLFEVRAGHAPLMATLSPGMLEVHRGGTVQKTFVRGGFADVSPNGLTILAEKAVAEAELKGDVVADEKALAQKTLGDSAADPDAQLDAQRALGTLENF
ncbi:MAG: ATP synthase F1 subunit epsilon [Parvularculaceae bacterium]|nr:ATP synthase F1 subunit epsilon [Parvularculaceae bacterium]